MSSILMKVKSELESKQRNSPFGSMRRRHRGPMDDSYPREMIERQETPSKRTKNKEKHCRFEDECRVKMTFIQRRKKDN